LKEETESKIAFYFGLSLWIVSGALTVLFAIGLAGNNTLLLYIYGFASANFEGAKIFLWRKGGGYRIAACFFIAFSLVGSFFSTVELVDQFKSETMIKISKSDNYDSKLKDLNTSIAQSDSLIKAMTDRYINTGSKTSAEAYEKSLNEERSKRQYFVSERDNLLKEGEATGVSSKSSSSLYNLLKGKSDNAPIGMYLISAFFSILIELGGTLLAGTSIERKKAIEVKVAKKSYPLNPVK